MLNVEQNDTKEKPPAVLCGTPIGVSVVSAGRCCGSGDILLSGVPRVTTVDATSRVTFLSPFRQSPPLPTLDLLCHILQNRVVTFLLDTNVTTNVAPPMSRHHFRTTAPIRTTIIVSFPQVASTFASPHTKSRHHLPPAARGGGGGGASQIIVSSLQSCATFHLVALLARHYLSGPSESCRLFLVVQKSLRHFRLVALDHDILCISPSRIVSVHSSRRTQVSTDFRFTERIHATIIVSCRAPQTAPPLSSPHIRL
jgi:hypothetical protein